MNNPFPPIVGAVSSDVFVPKRFIGYDDYPRCSEKHDIYWVQQSCEQDLATKRDCYKRAYCACCLACEAENKRDEEYMRDFFQE